MQHLKCAISTFQHDHHGPMDILASDAHILLRLSDSNLVILAQSCRQEVQ